VRIGVLIGVAQGTKMERQRFVMFELICVGDNERREPPGSCLGAKVKIWSGHSVLKLACFVYGDTDIFEIGVCQWF
jgi:hypothetical protein